jgi:ADP-L-glycero-D-manno-heptose 6-epimerase
MTLPGKDQEWTVLVTGGAGFIGSNLVRRIEADWPNARVTVLDDFRSGNFKNLEGFRGDLVTADLAIADLRAYFDPNEFQAIFHLASITDTRVEDQFKMCHDNIEAFRNLLEFALESGTPVTYASSAATYGVSDESKPNTEEDPRKPANVYGYSKVQLENLSARFLERAGDSGFKINGVRYFNVYGPGEAHKESMASMVYQLYTQMKAKKNPRIFKDGEQKRDFVHVDDAVECTLRAFDKGIPGVFNTGSGEAQSFNQLIEYLNEALETKLRTDFINNPYEFFQPFTQADLSRSKEMLGYEPKYKLKEGVADYVKWLEAQPKA